MDFLLAVLSYFLYLMGVFALPLFFFLGCAVISLLKKILVALQRQRHNDDNGPSSF